MHAGEGEARIGYWPEKKPTDPEGATIFQFYLPEKFVIRIDSTKKIPTAEFMMSQSEGFAFRVDTTANVIFADPMMAPGGGYVIIIRINQEDYDRCPCLPEPTADKVAVPLKK